MYSKIEHTPRLLLWFCRVALRIAAENWGRIFQTPISAGMYREIADLGKEINEALWPNGKPPKVYED
jgi:hypothetical protein